MDEQYSVVVGAGALRSADPHAVKIPHKYTPQGVTIEGSFTGAHLLHLSVAGCVLNDLYREAQKLGIPIDGVRVKASGKFDPQSWVSSGIEYAVELRSEAEASRLEDLLKAVDEAAETPKAVRAGAKVSRTA